MSINSSAAAALLAVAEMVSFASGQCVPRWTALDPPIFNPVLVSAPDSLFGSLYAGGGSYGRRIGTWDGATLSPVTSDAYYDIGNFVVVPPGALGASERTFVAALRADNMIQCWNGSDWQTIGTVSSAFGAAGPWPLALFDDGIHGTNLYFATRGEIGGVLARGLARWDGTFWWAVPTELDFMEVNAMCVYAAPGQSSNLYLGGSMESRPALAKYDGTSVRAISGPQTSAPFNFYRIRALAVHDDGAGSALIVGSDSPCSIAGVPGTGGLAKWNGSIWQSLGGDVTGTLSSRVDTIQSVNDGQGPGLVVAGSFSQIAGVRLNNIGILRNGVWSTMNGGTLGEVYGLAALNLGPARGVYAVGARPVSLAGPDTTSVWRWSAPDGNGPTITTQPSPRQLQAGDSATLTVVASNSAGASFRWRRAGIALSDAGAISGSGTATLQLTMVGASDVGDYDVVVQTTCGYAISQTAHVSVSGRTCPADLNGDDLVDDADFQIFVVGYIDLLCP